MVLDQLMKPWVNSDRKSRLPHNWQSIRRAILTRDNGVCQHHSFVDGSLCRLPATDVDHIVPGDNHSLTNLQALCSHHHAEKSAREGSLAMQKKRKEISSRFRFNDDTHPFMRGR